MDNRVHQVLDGELARYALSESEQAELLEAEQAISAALRAVPAEPLPALGATVLERIAGEHKAAPARFRLADVIAWLWRPRPLSLPWRPAYLLPIAAALVLVFWPLGRQREQSGVPAHVLVEFRLQAPQASHVALAGGFTNWQPAFALVRGEPGVWTIVVPLAPGVHDYAFIINGERWIPDPLAPAVDDGFGGLNSRLTVLPPDIAERS